jgi:hypothetical protein
MTSYNLSQHCPLRRPARFVLGFGFYWRIILGYSYNMTFTVLNSRNLLLFLPTTEDIYSWYAVIHKAHFHSTSPVPVPYLPEDSSRTGTQYVPCLAPLRLRNGTTTNCCPFCHSAHTFPSNISSHSSTMHSTAFHIDNKMPSNLCICFHINN